MSNSSYTLLNNSTNKLDVSIPVKEPVPSSTMNNSNEALKKRYMQIAFAVILYWYKIIFRFFALMRISMFYLGLFQ
jgi:hypothetical protein